MKIHYYPETDTLYLELRDEPSADTRDLGGDITLDLDAEGRPVALTVEHASEATSMGSLEVTEVPDVRVIGLAPRSTERERVSA